MNNYALLLVSAVAMLATVGSARTSLRLCEVSKGFAGEVFDKYTLTPNVEISSGASEALVLAVAPVVATGPVQASLNATFDMDGVRVSLMSNRDGLLVIEDSIPVGTDILIDVKNLRPDGSTPFVIYSYIANRPECFIDVEKGRTFSGPVPTSVKGVPAKLYLMSHPASSTSFVFNVDGGVGSTTTLSDSVDKIKSNNVRVLQGVEPQPWSSRGPVYMVVQPSGSAQPVWNLRASIVWKQEVKALPEGPTSAAPTSAPEEEPKKVESSWFATLLGLTILGGVCYFIGRSVYNYRVLEIHEFPECVPHHVGITEAASHAKGFFVSSKESFNTRRSAYSGVNGDDDDSV